MAEAEASGIFSGPAATLIAKLEHVLEPGMRRHLVLETLLGLGSARACVLMADVLDHAPEASPGWQQLRGILHDLVLSHPDGTPCGLPYAFRRGVYEVAVEGAHEEVMRLLRSVPDAGSEESGRRLPPDLADVPLGRRRSLAKSDDPHWLELLALDPDPVVMRNLLCNPRVCESDVIRIAALRPVSAATLHEIAGSSRWASNVRVRTAVARNPSCPSGLAIKLMLGLPLPVLREMRGDCDLHAETRQELQRELERRG